MKRLTAGLLLTATVLVAGPAAAQLSSRGGPIDITADELELVDAQHLAIWRGAVEAVQNGDRLHCDSLDIYFSGQPTAGGSSSGAPGRNWGKVQRMVAEGNIYFVTASQTARGDHADYELDTHTITVTGDVIVVQGQSVVHGDKLVIDTNTNQATMVSDVQGRGKPGRVRGVFYPNDNKTPGAPTPPPDRKP